MKRWTGRVMWGRKYDLEKEGMHTAKGKQGKELNRIERLLSPVMRKYVNIEEKGKDGEAEGCKEGVR